MAVAHDIEEISGVSALVGTPEQVRLKLGKSGKAERVIALTLEHGSESATNALASTVMSIVPLVSAILERRQQAAIDRIVEALVPPIQLPKTVLLEARMTAEARKGALEAADWLTAMQIAELAGFSRKNPSTQPNKWKREGLIFAVQQQGVDYFPAYALDAQAGYRPLKAMAQVLEVFGGRKGPWGLAIWFASLNGFLGGERPQDLIATVPSSVVEAARDEVEGAAHG